MIKSYCILVFIFFNLISYSITLSDLEKEWIKENPVVDIHFINPSRIYFYKENNEVKGIYKELFNEYEKKLGTKFNFVDLSKESFTKGINNGDIKVAFNVAQTSSREKNYNFLNSLIHYNIIGIYKDNFLNLKKLDKLKLGVITNTSQYNLLKKYYPELQYTFVSTYEEGYEFLEDKKIDVLIVKDIDDAFNNYYHHTFDRIPPEYLKIAVSKNDDILNAVIHKILNSFYERDLGNQIVKKVRNDFYKNFFENKKYYEDIKKDYSKLVVLIPDQNIYPFFYKNNSLTSGYIIDRLEEFSEITGIPIEYTYDKNEIYDLKVFDSENLNNDRYFSAYYNVDTAIFTNKKNEFLNSIYDIKSEKVGLISVREALKGSSFVKNNKIIKYLNIDHALNDLANKEIDYYLGDYKITSLKIKSNALEKQISLAYLSDFKDRLGFSMDDENLYKFFDNIIPKTVIEKEVINKVFIKPNISFKDYKLAMLILTISSFFIVVLTCLCIQSRKNSKKYKQILEALVDSFEKANELNDTETGEHTKRLNLYSELIAKKLNCSKKFINEISKFASLHDLGKIGISDNILKKPGKLTLEEFEEMKKHSKIGYDLISRMKIGKIAENIALHHHEKWNGTGYPEGLKDEEIPLEARIVALADVYDALRQKRVYKVGFSHKEALEIILKDREKHFDPKVVDVFEKYNLEFEKIFNESNS